MCATCMLRVLFVLCACYVCAMCARCALYVCHARVLCDCYIYATCSRVFMCIIQGANAIPPTPFLYAIHLAIYWSIYLTRNKGKSVWGSPGQNLRTFYSNFN